MSAEPLPRVPGPTGGRPDGTPPAIVMLADVDLSRADGTRSHVSEIATGFARRGRPVELVARGSAPALDGVRYVRAARRRGGRAGRVAAMNLASVRVLLRSRGRSRSLYYRYDAGMVGAVVVAKLLGYRAVGEMNNVMFGPGYERDPGARGWAVDRGKMAAMLVAARCTDHFVAVTGGIKQTMTDGYGTPASRVHVLTNGVDLERFRVWDREEALRRTGLDPSFRYAVFVGNLAPWVDVATIVAGFATAAATRPDARLVLVGDGPEAVRLAAATEAHGVGGQVVRVGSVTDRDLVSAYVGSATVCLIAYHAATLGRIGVSPMKLTEYFAAGRAVVGTELEGITEMIRESGGGTVVPATAAAVGAALGELLDDPERADRLGRAGRRAAEDRYSWSSVVERTLALLDGGR